MMDASNFSGTTSAPLGESILFAFEEKTFAASSSEPLGQIVDGLICKDQ